MTDENNNKPSKKREIKIEAKSRRGRKRNVSAQDLENAKATEKARIAAEQAEANKGADATPDAPLDKTQLASDYATKLDAHNARAQSLAEAKTNLSEQNTKYEAITAQTATAVAVLETQFKKDKNAKISAFINELHDIQSSLGNTAEELTDLASGNDALTNFVEGVKLTNDDLTKAFNKFSPKPVDETPEVSHSAKTAVRFDAQTFPAIEITENTSSEEIVKALADLETAGEADTANLAKTTEQLSKVTEALSHAAEESKRTLERQTRNLEKELAYALEKIAKEVLEVADNVERSLSALQDQKEILGGQYSVVETRMNKASSELQGAFNKFGIQKADTKAGQKQNVETDNAVAQVPAAAANATAGEIIEVASVGYVLKNEKHGDRLLRESQVIMAI